MIRLADLLKEIAEEKKPTPEEQMVIDDLLGSLQEGTFSNLLAKAKDYAKKGLLTATVLSALMAAPELTSAQKSQIQSLPKAQVTAPTTKQGTAVDGIYGQYTSQFRFPGAAEIDKLTNVKTDLGLEGNTALKQLKSFGTGKMEVWNKLTDFAQTHTINGKKIFGNPDLDKDSDLGQQVIDAFNQSPEGKGSWIKDTNDVKLAQTAMKAYRVARVADWKAGAEDIKKGLKNTHSTITMSDDKMDPTNVDHVKRVDSNFMFWAKDKK